VGELRCPPNTRFHHYFDLAADDRPVGLSFAASTDGAVLPTLIAEVPDAVGGHAHTLQSAQLRDSFGTVVGTIRFDTRQLGPDAAAGELRDSGLWTEDAAEAYANALGVAKVDPILARLRPIPEAAARH
jgi:hypothetical protein